MDPIYFDHAATTPVDKRVLEKMLPYFTEEFGNASSAHQFGRTSKVAMEEAREQIAELIGAEPKEIIFTSGGTESDNAFMKGVFAATNKTEIITSPIEHHAIIHPAESLKRQGVKIIYLEPDKKGMIHPGQVEEAITDQTALITLMHVNIRNLQHEECPFPLRCGSKHWESSGRCKGSRGGFAEYQRA